MIKIDFTTKSNITPEYVYDKYGNNCLLDENGKYHSCNDFPAVITRDGSKLWYKHGEKHRDKNLPAIVWYDGQKQYWVDGKIIYK